MVPDEQVPGDRWIPRRRKGIGGRRRWGGSDVAATPFLGWGQRGGDSVGGAVAAVSARKLAASLWQLAATTNGGGSVRRQCGLSFDRLGFQFCSSMRIPIFATEGLTKWDYCNPHAWQDVSLFQRNVKLTSAASARRTELFKAQKQVNELEAEPGWPRTKSRYCMKKLNEERASCIATARLEMCSLVKNLADGVKRERKNCEKMDMMNSKLLRDIAEARLSARKFVENLEKEKKAREELEDVCNNLAKEIEGNKAEIRALRNERKRIQLKVEEERKMLQIAEVWREEQAQMKLADAKLILEDKHAEISNLVADLKAFLRRLNLTTAANMMSRAKVLRQALEPHNIHGVKDFTFKFPKSDKMFAIIENSQTSEAGRRRADQYRSSHDQAHYASIVHHINPEGNDDAVSKNVHSNGLTGCGSGFEGMIGTETVAQAEIYPNRTSSGESRGSVNKIIRRKYMSNCNTESNKNAHYESQKSEASEVSSVSLMQAKKKGSSACKTQRALPRNKDACKTIMINRSSNRSIPSIISKASPQRVSGERALNVRRNPHVIQAMKGHIEWRPGTQRHDSASNLLEAKLASQKMLLRNALKQRS